MKSDLPFLAPAHPSDVLFLGYALSQYEARTGMDEEALATFLGCPPASLPRLALRGRPDPMSPTFRTDLQRLSDQFGVNAESLASLLQMVSDAGGQVTDPTAVRRAPPTAVRESAR